MYEITFSRRARRYFQRADANMIRRLNERIEELRVDPISHTHSRPLRGYPGYHRNRLANLRLLYTVDENEMSIRMRYIGPRGDVYRSL